MADLRHILIPVDIDVYLDKAAWSWCRCVEHLIKKDPRFNSDGEGIRSGVRILKQIMDDTKPKNPWLKKAGDVLLLDLQDWRLLHMVMEKPVVVYGIELWTCGWMPPVWMQVLPANSGGETAAPVTQLCAQPAGSVFLPYIDALSDENTKAPKAESKAPEPTTPPAASAPVSEGLQRERDRKKKARKVA